MSSDAESRLLALERKVIAIDYRIRAVEQVRVPAQEQALAQEWMLGLGDMNGQTPGASGNIIITCWSETGPFVGATVVLESSTVVYGTGTTNSSGQVGFTVPTGNYNIRVSVPGGPGPYSLPPIGLGGPGINGLATAPATGTNFYNVLIYLATTAIKVADTRFGDKTMTWNASQNCWLGLWSGNTFSGCGPHGCAASSLVQIQYKLLNTSFFFATAYTAISPSNPCPAPQLGATPLWGDSPWTSATPTSYAPLAMTATQAPTSYLYCNSGPTFAITKN